MLAWHFFDQQALLSLPLFTHILITGHNTKQLHIIKLPEELQPALPLKPCTQSTPGLSLSTMSWIYSFLIETTLVVIFIVRPFLWSPLQVI